MAKQAITLYSIENTYKSLQSFNTIQHLNDTVKYYRNLLVKSTYKNKRNLMILMDYLKRYSCKFFGVSYKGKRKIGEDLGFCRKTITRLTKTLSDLGYIKEYECKRVKDNQQTTNVIVIQQCKAVPQDSIQPEGATIDKSREKQVRSKDLSHLKTHNFRKHNINNKYIRKDVSFEQLGYEYTSDSVPKEFVQQVSGFAYFSTAARIEELFKCVRLLAIKLNMSLTDALPVAIDSFRQLINKMKKQTVRNPFAFYTGILSKKLKASYVNNMFYDVFDS